MSDKYTRRADPRLMGVLGAIVGIVFLVFLVRDTYLDSKNERIQQERRIADKCESAAREQLNEPSTARFSGGVFSDDGKTYSARLEAKNVAGEHIERSLECHLVDEKKDLVEVELRDRAR